MTVGRAGYPDYQRQQHASSAVLAEVEEGVFASYSSGILNTEDWDYIKVVIGNIEGPARIEVKSIVGEVFVGSKSFTVNSTQTIYIAEEKEQPTANRVFAHTFPVDSSAVEIVITNLSSIDLFLKIIVEGTNRLPISGAPLVEPIVLSTGVISVKASSTLDIYPTCYFAGGATLSYFCSKSTATAVRLEALVSATGWLPFFIITPAEARYLAFAPVYVPPGAWRCSVENGSAEENVTVVQLAAAPTST